MNTFGGRRDFISIVLLNVEKEAENRIDFLKYEKKFKMHFVEIKDPLDL